MRRKSLLFSIISICMTGALIMNITPAIPTFAGDDSPLRPAVPPVSDVPLKEATGVIIKDNPDTICNPVNISYQYQQGYNGRESADPAAVLYDGTYYLFASHGSGYWWSEDLADWNYIYAMDSPNLKPAHLSKHAFEYFAPATMVYDGYLYITHSESGAMFKSNDPKDPDSWEYVRDGEWGDPALFADDDGRVFCYYGLSDKDPLYVIELDPNNNMANIGTRIVTLDTCMDVRGWERSGENNERSDRSPYLEGAWMTKHDGKYYLQYAVPGTEFATYANGLYVGDSPLGPFEYCDYSPLTYKATGFVRGAGHGSTLQDKNGNWWKFDTVSISVNNVFERRLIMLPAQFTEDGLFVTNSVFADYPMYKTEIQERSFEQPGPEWNLVSYNPTVAASSQLNSTNRSPDNAFNENMKTWWSAATGNAGEYIEALFDEIKAVNALQINFADQDVKTEGTITPLNGRLNNYCHQYIVEFSTDGGEWHTLIDKSGAVANPKMAQDYTHQYFEFEKTVGIRYIRVINKGAIPLNGKFAISGIRLFGHGQGEKTQLTPDFTVTRDVADERNATISWTPVQEAQGYIVRYGSNEHALNIHCQVIGQNSVTVRNLTMDVDYYFTVDNYNDKGYVPGTYVRYCRATVTPPDQSVLDTDDQPVLQPKQAKAGFEKHYSIDSVYASNVVKRGDSNAERGQTLGNLHNPGAYFEFSNVDGGAGGDGIVRIVFTNGNDSTSYTEIVLNGTSLGRFPLYKTGSWSDPFMMMDFVITGLEPGETNTLRFNCASGGWNPDYVQVYWLTSSDIPDRLSDTCELSHDGKSVRLPVQPGFDVTIKESSNPDIIGIDGKVYPYEEDETVTLTLLIRNKKDAQDTIEKDVTVLVPGSNKSALLQTYDNNKNKAEKDYTPLSWERFAAAMEYAEALFEDNTVVRKYVERAVKEIEASVRALDYIGVLPPSRLKGDVNDDKAINIFDIMLIRDHIFGKSILEDDDFTAADVNGDEDVNIFDIMMIRDYIFGKVTAL